MWALNFLPDSVFHALVVLGLAGFFVGLFFDFVLPIRQYRSIIQVASAAALVVGVWYEGGIAKDAEYQSKIEEYQQRVQIAEALSASYNQQLKQSIEDNKKKIDAMTGSNKKRIKDLTQKINAECKVDAPIIDILNSAAKGSTP